MKGRGQKFKVQTRTQVPNGIGGHTATYTDSFTITGFLDLTGGTDHRSMVENNALIENSTHVLLTDHDERLQEGMRIVSDSNGKTYLIIYADDPVSLQHHMELYLKNEVV